ncbi:MAG: anti-sigma factor [Phycisphaerales bacterium]|nr:anti-sigma factor [Phycisphaerales bacterium]
MSEYRDNPAGGEPIDAGDDAAWARTLDAVFVSLSQEQGGDQRPLSDALRRRLEREGEAALSGQDSVEVAGTVGRPVARPGLLVWSGWAAAAVIALAFFVFGVPGKGAADAGSAQLVKQVDGAADVVSWPFAGLTDEFKGAQGSVVWSSSLQKGYMRLTGVPVNTPTLTQYQLWIVDPARDPGRVDGGVFDVAGGEVVVPIDAKLAVRTPAAFAITREKAGGVVVSAGPLLMAAAAPQ